MRDQDRRHPRLLGQQRLRADHDPAGTGTVTQITAGDLHTCAIKTDRTPTCWGDNDYGQRRSRPAPGPSPRSPPARPTRARSRPTAPPACWGHNDYGQATIPAGTGTVTQITAGVYHTCAIKTDGTPICWGDDGDGQRRSRGARHRHPDRRRRYHTCAIKTDGSPVCWGEQPGQTTSPPNLGTFTQITAGGGHTCAITTAGPPPAGAATPRGQTTIPPALGTVTQVAAGVSHTCALKTDGTVRSCWGSNAWGQALVPPHNTTRPQITGTAKVGSTVAATTGSWDNSPTGFTYAWSRCTTNNTLATCTPIAGANQSSYALSVADDTLYVRVFVTATNASGSVAQHSDPVKITRVKPANTARPTITGTPKVGSLLTATSGDWDQQPERLRVCVAALHDEQLAGLVHADRLAPTNRPTR